MGRITVSKVNHFMNEYLPFLNSIKRKPRVKQEETDAEKLKKVVAKTWKRSENPEIRVEENEESDLLIKSNMQK